MSDQYPQYQPPAGDGSPGPQGGSDQSRRDEPFGQSPQPGPYGQSPQYGQAPQYGQSPQYGDPGTGGYGGQPTGQAPWTPDPGYQYQQQSTPPPPPYGAPAQSWTPPPPGAGSNAAASAKGFLAALFDFNFDTFITPKIIKAVYIVVTALIGVAAVGFLLSAVISGEPGVIVAALIGVPLVAIVYLALARMTLELYFAVVRLSEDVRERLPRQ